MADEMKKDMQKISDDDLFSVSGGISIYSGQGRNIDTFNPAEKPVLSGGLGTGSNLTGGTENTQNVVGMGTVTRYCPGCKHESSFIVLSGGMGKCQECGYFMEKL